MTIDTSTSPFTATAEHLIDTVAQARQATAAAIRERDEARADAKIQRLRGDALEAELYKVTDELRRAINAGAYLKARAEQAEAELRELRDRPTVELPRVAEPEPAPSRRRRRGKHQ